MKILAPFCPLFFQKYSIDKYLYSSILKEKAYEKKTRTTLENLDRHGTWYYLGITVKLAGLECVYT